MATSKPIRIGGASGGFTDRVAAISRLAKDPAVDAIVGDWLSENTMAPMGAAKSKQGEDINSQSLEERKKTACYANTFLQCFEPAIDDLAKNGAKLVVNAGGSDTELLAEVCLDLTRKRGHEFKVAWIEGDDVTAQFSAMVAEGNEFKRVTDGKSLKEWGFEPLSAQAYLGSLGIAKALEKGADIVIAGRVSDAAPTIGLSAWWHGWNADHLDQLAGALIAGHLIECSAFITGGYYSRFKDLMKAKKHLNLGFPIAEVSANGECVITKEQSSNGVVNTETVTSQLLYEISGPLYFNSDVIADLHGVKLDQQGEDRVHVSNIKGLPPPPTTRCGITAHGGYQAEWHFYLVGLDIEEKCQWMEEQARYAIGEDLMKQFTTLKFHVHGTSPANPGNQEIATVDFRIFAQAQDATLFDPSLPDGFSRRLYETVLQSCPGVSRSNDLRQSTAKSYFEYFVTLVPQSICNHRAHRLFGDNEIIDIPVPTNTKTYRPQESYDTKDPIPLDQFGEITEAPLGYIALGRSGDKASDANVGFFVSNDEQWQWLRSYLSIAKLKELLGPEEYVDGKWIDRFEMANIRAVHFLLKDHLDRGYNSGSKLDTLAKNLCEYLRAKHVPIPTKFLQNGRVRARNWIAVLRGLYLVDLVERNIAREIFCYCNSYIQSPASSNMTQQFSGKVIAITGAASGIGLATAKLLASRGAKLSLADVSDDNLRKAKKDIEAEFNADVIATKTDVRKYAEVESWISETVKHFGRLDGAANIAGVIPKSIGNATVAEQDLDDWDFLFSVNVTGLMHCMKAQLQVMGDGGSIVNACSIAGLMGRSKNASYASAKHAVLGLTRSAAKEFGSKNIRVNCFCPGKINTPMNAAADKIANIPNPCALGRDGKPDEVAKPIAFLLSEESSYISGVALSIDGGWAC